MGGGTQLFWEALSSISLQPCSDYANFERAREEAQNDFVGPGLSGAKKALNFAGRLG